MNNEPRNDREAHWALVPVQPAKPNPLLPTPAELARYAARQAKR